MRLWNVTYGRVAAVLVGATLALACGGQHQLNPGPGSGSGGAPGSGGAAGSGGTPGSGGGPAATGGTGDGGNWGGANGSGGAGGGDCAPVPVPSGGKVCADILIDSAAAATAAADCIEATGGLTISPTFTGTVELPRLRKVGKDVRRDGAPKPTNASDPAQTTRVRLPNVTEIGGDLWFYLDFNLVELDLRSVVTIGGRAWVYRDTLIRTLRLDALHTVGQDLYIGDVFALPDCVAKDIASHVTAGQTAVASGATTPSNCHCGPVCGHVEQLCP